MLIDRSSLEWTPTGIYLDSAPKKKDFFMRDMQGSSFMSLKDAQFALLNAPTACGKTLAMCYIVAHTLHHNSSRKALIIVPQKIIGAGFNFFARLHYSLDEDKTQVLDEEQVLKWSPKNYLCNDSEKMESSNTKTVQKFLRNKVRYSDFNDRVTICTHSTFSRVFKESPELFKNVLVCCDEAHHAQFSDYSSFSKDDKNCLGGFLQYAIENKDKNIRLIMSTATFYRGDSKSIIPDKYIGLFEKFYYPMDKYLSKCSYLSGFSYKFAMYDQKWGDELLSVFKTKPNSKFITYIPNVNSKRYSYGSKNEDVNKVYEAIAGKSNPEIKEEKSGITLIRRGDDWIKVVNLVDDSNLKLREKRLNLIIEADKHEDNSMIDGIITLEMFKEGANWKWADTIFLIGAKGSLTAMIQIIGRLLRDAKGKTRVDFYQFLPKNINSIDSEEFRINLNDYLKMVFAAMIIDDLICPVSLDIDFESETNNGKKSGERKFKNYLRMVAEDTGKELSILKDIYSNVCLQSDHGVDFKTKTDKSIGAFEWAVREALSKAGINESDIESYHKQIADQTWNKWLVESVRFSKINMGIDVSKVDFELLIKMGEEEGIDPLSFMDVYQTKMTGASDLSSFRKSIRKVINPKVPMPYEEARKIAHTQGFSYVKDYKAWVRGEKEGLEPYVECPEGMPLDLSFYKTIFNV